MKIDIDGLRPVESGDISEVYFPSQIVTLYNDKSGKSMDRKLNTMQASELVELLGGTETFAEYVFPETDAIAWLRRSRIRGVVEGQPDPSDGLNAPWSIVQMVYHRKIRDPWPWSAWGSPDCAFTTPLVAAEARRLLDARGPIRWPEATPPRNPPTAEQLSTALASSPLVGAAEDIIALARPQWFALEASEAEASSFLLDPSGAASGPTPVFALDLARSNADLALPRQGALIFSYDASSKPWGDEPTDAGSFSVMLSQASAREAAEASGLRSVAIGLVEGIGLPAIDSLPGELLPIDSDDEAEAYLELLEEFFGEPGSPGGAPGTWLLGYPYQLQDDMQEQCAEMAKSAWGLESEPEEWRLLLQLASESAANMCWEDDGFLYFWIRESDLAKHDFSHVWCILQTM